jgi:hypothetical protein
MGGMKDTLGDTPFRLPHQLTRRDDPHTSFEAAAKVVPKLREMHKLVWETLRKHPNGLTDIELEEICGSHGSTYRTRRSELVAMGLVIDTGTTRVINGHNRKVWKAKIYGEKGPQVPAESR